MMDSGCSFAALMEEVAKYQPSLLDSVGMRISLNGLPHTAALRQAGRALYPRGVSGWLRRNLWWRLFPAWRQALTRERGILQGLVQQELLNAVLAAAADFDRAVSELRVVYKCQRAGTLNRDFDRALEAVAQEYGLEFYGSGLDARSGERDLAFDRWPEDEEGDA